MSKVIIGGGGARGIDSDELTASTIDVLAGKKFGGVGSDEVQIGTMPYIGSARKAIDGGLNPQGLYYHIPKGYYQEGTNDPWVYLTQPEVAPIIGATGNKIIPGQSICGVAGTVPTMGAQTINPSASQQSIATSGKYMTGNITVNPIPSNYYNVNNNQMLFKNGSFGTLANGGAMYFGYTGTTFGYTENASIENGNIMVRTSINSHGIKANQKDVRFRRAIPIKQFSRIKIKVLSHGNGNCKVGLSQGYDGLKEWWSWIGGSDPAYETNLSLNSAKEKLGNPDTCSMEITCSSQHGGAYYEIIEIELIN